MTDLSRRDFLKLATTGLVTASGLLGLRALLRFLGNPPEPPSQTVLDLGPASNYRVGSRIVVAGGSALLIHTKDGFSALSLICTHLGFDSAAKVGALSNPRIMDSRVPVMDRSIPRMGP